MASLWEIIENFPSPSVFTSPSAISLLLPSVLYKQSSQSLENLWGWGWRTHFCRKRWLCSDLRGQPRTADGPGKGSGLPSSPDAPTCVQPIKTSLPWWNLHMFRRLNAFPLHWDCYIWAYFQPKSTCKKHHGGSGVSHKLWITSLRALLCRPSWLRLPRGKDYCELSVTR